MNWAILAIGIGVLVIVAAGVMLLWVADARRAEDVASDPERVDPGPSGERSSRRRRR